jgi:hypothetical protein
LWSFYLQAGESKSSVDFVLESQRCLFLPSQEEIFESRRSFALESAGRPRTFTAHEERRLHALSHSWCVFSTCTMLTRVVVLTHRIGTPHEMSLSRSPSPIDGGGWSSPGLSSPYVDVSGRHSPVDGVRSVNGGGSVSWESTQKKTAIIKGGPSFSSQNSGFFNRHIRQLSNSLPRFSMSPEHSYAEKEKLGRGRWATSNGTIFGKLRSSWARVGRKLRLRLMVLLAFILSIIIFYNTRKSSSLHKVAVLTS